LVLALEVDRTAHQNERCVERVIVGMLSACLEEVVREADDMVVDALLLALLVDRHVAKNSEAELCNFSIHFLKLRFCLSVVEKQRELFNSIFAKKRFDSHVAKSQIHESFKKLN